MLFSSKKALLLNFVNIFDKKGKMSGSDSKRSILNQPKSGRQKLPKNCHHFQNFDDNFMYSPRLQRYLQHTYIHVHSSLPGKYINRRTFSCVTFVIVISSFPQPKFPSVVARIKVCMNRKGLKSFN
jgi:hypothetical protein